MQKPILSLNSTCIVGGILWLLPVIVVHADEIVCPAVIHFSQAPIISSAEGWNVSSRAARMLNDGGFLSSGDPKEQADLKGEDAVVDGKKGHLWEIDPEDNRRGSGSRVVMDSGLFCLPEKFRERLRHAGARMSYRRN